MRVRLAASSPPWMLDPSYRGSPTLTVRFSAVAKKSELKRRKTNLFAINPDRRVQTAPAEGPRGSQAGRCAGAATSHTIH
jgi:hypothetical protein